MPPEPRHTIEVRPPLVVITAEGRLTMADWIAVLDQVRRTPGFEPSYHQLVDATSAHFFFTYADARTLAFRVAQDLEVPGASFHVAYVVGSEATWGVARMVQSVFEESPMTVGLFRDMDEAEEWLGKHAPPPRRDPPMESRRPSRRSRA